MSMAEAFQVFCNSCSVMFYHYLHIFYISYLYMYSSIGCFLIKSKHVPNVRELL